MSMTDKAKSSRIEFNSDEDDDGLLFEKALNKKQFLGNKGHLLMELQQSYKNDDRFLIDKKFKDDIDKTKVSKSVKSMTHLFDKNKSSSSTDNVLSDKVSKSVQNLDFQVEKNKNLSILSQIIPNSEFLVNNTTKKFTNPKNLLQKRFDPTLNLGKDLVIDNSKRDNMYKQRDTQNVVKLERGVNRAENDENLMLPADKLKKFEKEKSIQKSMNQLQNALETKVEVNYNSWKNITKKDDEEKKMVYSIFDGGFVEGEAVNRKQKESFSLFNQSSNKNNKNSKSAETETENATEESLLQKKRQKEKKKLKEKLKKEQLKMEVKNKEEKVEKVWKQNLLKEFDQEKVENYMRYVNLVKEKKK